jgi:hypothetical protein
MPIRIFIAVFVFASLTASMHTLACGYTSLETMGSDDCTGGATASDRQTMSDIRDAIAAQRALAAQEQAARDQQ